MQERLSPVHLHCSVKKMKPVDRYFFPLLERQEFIGTLDLVRIVRTMMGRSFSLRVKERFMVTFIAQQFWTRLVLMQRSEELWETMTCTFLAK